MMMVFVMRNISSVSRAWSNVKYLYYYYMPSFTWKPAGMGCNFTSNCSKTLIYLNFQMKAVTQLEVFSLICSCNLLGCNS